MTDAQNNIKKADIDFLALDQDKTLTCIAKNTLYYRTLEQGQGPQINKPSKVTLQCKVEIAEGLIVTDTWANNKPIEMHLNDAISGFAWRIKGMRQGETRELFIHPSVGYGIYTFLEKGIPLKAQIELVFFEEDENSHDFPPLSPLDFTEDFAVLDGYNFAKASKIAGYFKGYEIGDHYKQTPFYTLDSILEYLKQFKVSENKMNYESEENQDLLNRLHWNIYYNPVKPPVMNIAQLLG